MLKDNSVSKSRARIACVKLAAASPLTCVVSSRAGPLVSYSAAPALRSVRVSAVQSIAHSSASVMITWS
jgi:hypothetical protein